jgi:hypothetical protein
VYLFLQTLCILTNVADGEDAKGYIMENEDVLKKLMTYMVNIFNTKQSGILVFGVMECVSNILVQLA